MSKTCWQHGNVLATWKLVGNMLGTCWQHVGKSVTCWKLVNMRNHVDNILETGHHPAGNLLAANLKPVGNTLKTCRVSAPVCDTLSEFTLVQLVVVNKNA